MLIWNQLTPLLSAVAAVVRQQWPPREEVTHRFPLMEMKIIVNGNEKNERRDSNVSVCSVEMVDVESVQRNLCCVRQEYSRNLGSLLS